MRAFSDRRRVRRVAVAALLIASATAGLTVSNVLLGFGADVTRRASDIPWPIGRADARVVVVQIDSEAQAAYGAWPWTRNQQAELVRGVAAGGAAAIGYDVLTADIDRPGSSSDELADALTLVPTVMPVSYASIVRTGRGLYVGSEAVEPGPEVSAAAAAVGHVVIPADADGIIRRVPLVMQTPAGELLPSFALQLAAVSADSLNEPVVVRPTAVTLGAITAPVETGATLRVSWTRGLERAGPQVVSAAEVLRGPTDQLEGAIVIVGVADATIGDTHVTPLQPGATTPGVIVQAQTLSTLLQTSWVYPAQWWLSALIVLMLAAPVAAAALTIRLWVAIIITLVTVAGYVAAALLLLPATGVQLDLVRVPFAVLIAAVAAGAVRLIREQRARRAAVTVFSRYVPRAVAARLLETEGEAALAAGARVDGAVLFCDLRGFTPLAAGMDAADVRRALEHYYNYACERIFARGGTVMQFVGDEVFAVFGAPEPLDDPAGAARDTARALVTDRPILDDALTGEGLPVLTFGIGVHAGQLIAGTVGPAGRRQYAVVGDVVNVGSRLCSAAHADEIVASVAAAADWWADRVVESLQVKGKDAPIDVVRVDDGTVQRT